MNNFASESAAQMRQSELLISIGVSAELGSEPTKLKEGVRLAAEFLSQRFEFWEIAILLPERLLSENRLLFKEIASRPNVRILFCHLNLDPYEALSVLASETIGDFAIITTTEELVSLDLEAIWAKAEATGKTVLLRRQSASIARKLGSLILSLITGYRIDPRMMFSSARYRADFNALLQRPDRDLALRFTLGEGDGGEIMVVDGPRPKGGALKRLVRNASVTVRLFSFAAPRLLKAVAIVSSATMLSAIVYFLYVITLWVGGAQLAEGWVTISVALSLSTAFMAAALGCITLGTAKVLDALRGPIEKQVLGEISAADLFSQVGVLNVELESPRENRSDPKREAHMSRTDPLVKTRNPLGDRRVA